MCRTAIVLVAVVALSAGCGDDDAAVDTGLDSGAAMDDRDADDPVVSAPERPVVVDDGPSTTARTPLPSTAAGTELRPHDGIWFRLSARTQSGPAVHVSLSEDGHLVTVRGLDVYQDPDAATVRQVTPAGVERIIDAIVSTRILDGDNRRWGDLDYSDPGVSVGLFHGEGFVVSADGLFEDHARLTADEHALRAELESVVEQLLDPTWLGADLGPEAPWDPETATVFLVDEERLHDEPRTWPLPGAVADAVEGTDADTGYSYACLSGNDAAAVWRLLGDGYNSSSVPVVDSTGARATVRIDVQLPGYRLYGDPCTPA